MSSVKPRDPKPGPGAGVDAVLVNAAKRLERETWPRGMIGWEELVSEAWITGRGVHGMIDYIRRVTGSRRVGVAVQVSDAVLRNASDDKLGAWIEGEALGLGIEAVLELV